MKKAESSSTHCYKCSQPVTVRTVGGRLVKCDQDGTPHDDARCLEPSYQARIRAAMLRNVERKGTG